MDDGCAEGAGGVDRALREAASKVSKAKHELDSAARHEDNCEQTEIYRHHAEQLGVAIDTIREVSDD